MMQLVPRGLNMQREGLDTQLFFDRLYEDVIMKTLGKKEYSDFYEDPIKTYKIKAGEIAKFSRRRDIFILGKYRTWKAKGHIPDKASPEAKAEYPVEAIYIKRHPNCPQYPKGILLTPLARKPGDQTVEKASGAKRIEFDGSISDAFKQFYAKTEIKLALLVYKSLIKKGLNSKPRQIQTLSELIEMIEKIENTEQIGPTEDLINRSYETGEITSKQRNGLLKRLIKASKKFKDQETAFKIGPFGFGVREKKK